MVLIEMMMDYLEVTGQLNHLVLTKIYAIIVFQQTITSRKRAIETKAGTVWLFLNLSVLKLETKWDQSQLDHVRLNGWSRRRRPTKTRHSNNNLEANLSHLKYYSPGSRQSNKWRKKGGKNWSKSQSVSSSQKKRRLRSGREIRPKCFKSQTQKHNFIQNLRAMCLELTHCQRIALSLCIKKWKQKARLHGSNESNKRRRQNLHWRRHPNVCKKTLSGGQTCHQNRLVMTTRLSRRSAKR